MSLADTLARGALALAVVVGGIAGIAGAAAAQAIVVRSTGPSAAAYPMGRKLPANAAVTLKAGDHVTVLDKGGTRVLAGPGSFRLDAAAAGNAGGGTAVADLFARGGARTRTGAVRGAPGDTAAAAPTGPDSVWYVDVSKGGTYCVADPAQVVLWRPNRDETGTGMLSADGATAEVTWRAGSAIKLWPAASMPVADGKVYRFANPVGQTVTITLKMLPTVPDDEVEVAGLFADRGCTAQLGVMADAAEAPPSGS